MTIQTIALALTYLGGFPVVTTKDLHKGLWQSMTYMASPVLFLLPGNDLGMRVICK